MIRIGGSFKGALMIRIGGSFKGALMVRRGGSFQGAKFNFKIGALILGRTRETPQRGPFLTLLVALLKGTLLRGSISLTRVSLILTPTLMTRRGFLLRGAPHYYDFVEYAPKPY